MSRALTAKNVYDKKFSTFKLDGLYELTLGTPETHGNWIVYGREKHGKTTFAVILAYYLSQFAVTEYISAEQGIDVDFQSLIKRLNIDPSSRNMRFREYLPIEELDKKLESRKSADIIFIDNITVYAEELKNGMFRKLYKKHSKKLFVWLAHEESGEPYTATAKMCKKLAKRIIRVEGLAATVEGRGPGGAIIIDDKKAQLYHGSQINKE